MQNIQNMKRMPVHNYDLICKLTRINMQNNLQNNLQNNMQNNKRWVQILHMLLAWLQYAK